MTIFIIFFCFFNQITIFNFRYYIQIESINYDNNIQIKWYLICSFFYWDSEQIFCDYYMFITMMFCFTCSHFITIFRCISIINVIICLFFIFRILLFFEKQAKLSRRHMHYHYFDYVSIYYYYEIYYIFWSMPTSFLIFSV